MAAVAVAVAAGGPEAASEGAEGSEGAVVAVGEEGSGVAADGRQGGGLWMPIQPVESPTLLGR